MNTLLLVILGPVALLSAVASASAVPSNSHMSPRFSVANPPHSELWGRPFHNDPHVQAHEEKEAPHKEVVPAINSQISRSFTPANLTRGLVWGRPLDHDPPVQAHQEKGELAPALPTALLARVRSFLSPPRRANSTTKLSLIHTRAQGQTETNSSSVPKSSDITGGVNSSVNQDVHNTTVQAGPFPKALVDPATPAPVASQRSAMSKRLEEEAATIGPSGGVERDGTHRRVAVTGPPLSVGGAVLVHVDAAPVAVHKEKLALGGALQHTARQLHSAANAVQQRAKPHSSLTDKQQENRAGAISSEQQQHNEVATSKEQPWGVTAVYPDASWGTGESETDAKLVQSRLQITDPNQAVHHWTNPNQAPHLTLGSILFPLSILVILLVALLCLVGFMPNKEWWRQPEGSEVRKWVKSMRPQTQEDIEDIFKPRRGYDCLLLQPQSPGVAVRVSGRIIARPEATLRAPITRRKCVLFSTSAAERRLDGVVAPPAAFHSMASNFMVELDQGLKLHVHGQDVALFDMAAGRHDEQVVLRDAPDAHQDFVRANRAPFSGGGLANSAVLEFQECLLEVGAKVTCVGEVRRSETGELGLWPAYSDAYTAVSASGLTSWERSEEVRARVGKVMVSDDPNLLK